MEGTQLLAGALQLTEEEQEGVAEAILVKKDLQGLLDTMGLVPDGPGTVRNRQDCTPLAAVMEAALLFGVQAEMVMVALGRHRRHQHMVLAAVPVGIPIRLEAAAEVEG